MSEKSTKSLKPIINNKFHNATKHNFNYQAQAYLVTTYMYVVAPDTSAKTHFKGSLQRLSLMVVVFCNLCPHVT